MIEDQKIITYADRSRGAVAYALLWALAGLAILLAMGVRLRRERADIDTSAPAARDRARVLYERACFVCHGINGDGNGPAAFVLDPRPRSFKLGKYRLITSANGAPFKDDIINSIRNGMSGTSMPAWRDLSDEDMSLLADYVLEFSRKQIEQDLVAKKVKPATVKVLVEARTKPVGRVEIPPQPAPTAEGLARGKKLYLDTCAKCHNDDGSGRQDPAWKTEEGFLVASRNFTSNIFKGGGRGADLFARVYSGMPGTPMASFSAFSKEEIWDVVNYVRTLAAAPQNKGPVANAAASRQEAR